MFKNVSKYHLLLHLIVFIWGWTPILGRYISVGALQLVWFRIVITVVIMGLYLLYTRLNLRLSFKDYMRLCGVGLIICVHWLCFYGAIKVSNVSVTMAAFSTGTLFTAITEPLLFRRKMIWYELLIGLIIIGAVCLIFSVEIKYGLGILLGVGAAFTASIFSVLNGLLVKRIAPPVISFFELSFALIGLSTYLLASRQFSGSFFDISHSDWIYLLLLSGVCTAFPFIASVNLMKHLSPYTINLTINLEGVYGIILAGILFHEHKELSGTFYYGVVIILVAIFLNAFLKQKFQAKAA